MIETGNKPRRREAHPVGGGGGGVGGGGRSGMKLPATLLSLIPCGLDSSTAEQFTEEGGMDGGMEGGMEGGM